MEPEKVQNEEEVKEEQIPLPNSIADQEEEKDK